MSSLHRFALSLALACLACGPGDRARTLVFAASSLTEAFTELGIAFEESMPGTRLELHFAGTPTLVLQLREGAPAAVLATADERQMERAVALGLVRGDPRVFATAELTIATRSGNPLGIRGLRDLGREDVRVALCGSEVPAGRYARAVLANAGVEVESLSDEPSVRALAAKIALGELDAGIVYATDVAGSRRQLDAVPVPAGQGALATFPIALLAGAPNEASRARGASFIEFVRSASGREILARHGFEAP